MSDHHDGIILLAKQSGITSFSSLWQIKNALGTKKIGHTGTLDTFAEGLLVALSGRLTRLAPYITGCDKEYEALIEFGSETDTLDPDGSFVKASNLPTHNAIISVLDRFTGTIMQAPPSYSAVHVSGQRASERIRNGECVTLPSRPVTIHAISVMYSLSPDGAHASGSDSVSRMALRIGCSKGTYIRSLARDIAYSVDSCAHLAALRRTHIGPFSLTDAAGYSMLAPFGTVAPAVYGKGDKPPQVPSSEIIASVLDFTPKMASIIGFSSFFLVEDKALDFMHGKKPDISWFVSASGSSIPLSNMPSCRYTVFCGSKFMGMVRLDGSYVSYDFVAAETL